MRRALFAIAGLAAGTTLLVVLKSGPAATAGTEDVPAGLAREAGAAGPDGSPGAVPPGQTPAPGEPAAADPTGKPGPAASRTPAARQTGKTPSGSRTSSAPAKPSGPRTVFGTTAKADSYGVVQVQITVSGSTVTAVRAVELPFETPTSEQKSASVRNAYESQGKALAYATGRTATLDTVSGATATSGAYRRSLQAALDQV
ncbi:FMN-binding protein [Plantactinospora sp. GCM10030261]|uniref:FMN-binding protein n=1 Tax=Plantactinospora sp. GCM10030261 TaxID=3273420 RepID=UPI00360EA649